MPLPSSQPHNAHIRGHRAGKKLRERGAEKRRRIENNEIEHSGVPRETENE